MSDPSENSDDKNEPQADQTSNLKLRLNLNTFSSLTISRFSPLHKMSPGKYANDQNASPLTFKSKLQMKEKESSEQRNKIIKPESFHVIVHALKFINYPFRGLN